MPKFKYVLEMKEHDCKYCEFCEHKSKNWMVDEHYTCRISGGMVSKPENLIRDCMLVEDKSQ